MVNVIREARERHGVGVRELARRCDVAPATVVGWEASATAGTIQLSTLERALGALGESPRVGTRRSHQPAPLERREQRLGLELHRAIAHHLIDDPDAVLASAAERIPSLRASVRGGALAWIDTWDALIASRDLGSLIDVMLDTTQDSIDLRSVSPFAHLASPHDRLIASERAAS